MKVLVTGATGFVGGHLVDRLLAQGDTVTALVRSPQRAAALAERGVRLVAGDLADTGALADAVRDQQVVHHVAAMLGAPTEAALMATNRDGTINLVRACASLAARPRVVLVSSMAAGGPARRGVPKSPTTTTTRSPCTAGASSPRNVRSLRPRCRGVSSDHQWCTARATVKASCRCSRR